MQNNLLSSTGHTQQNSFSENHSLDLLFSMNDINNNSYCRLVQSELNIFLMFQLYQSIR